MDGTGLKIRFHNPNTEEETEKYIVRIFTEAGMIKLDRILQETEYQSRACQQQTDIKKGCTEMNFWKGTVS